MYFISFRIMVQAILNTKKTLEKRNELDNEFTLEAMI
jgi:hypothetical protein